MDYYWQATLLGLKQLPRELTAFEIDAFFRFTPAERQVMIIRSCWKAPVFGIVAITVALMSGVASAGDDAGDDLSAIVVTAPHYVPTTDTSATKIAIPLIETPQAVSVITRDQIDMLNF